MPAWMTRAGLLLPIGAATAPAASYDVTLNVGDNFQTVVDANPAGTSYFIASGVHREQQAIPKTGDSFTGPSDLSAVLNGSKILDPALFVFDSANSRYYIDGQTQENYVFFEATRTLVGYENDNYPEEVWVDGSIRLQHASSLLAMTAGQWFFDYTADRIYLKNDPNSYALIETSTVESAIPCRGATDVTIRNLTVEKYASQFQFGALGGDRTKQLPQNWLFSDLITRYNHGSGIQIGPGCTATHGQSYGNGQFGVSGSGDPGFICEMSYYELHSNGMPGINPGWGSGGTKFTSMRGMNAFHNWSHDNNGPGLWWDIDDRNCNIYSNLCEDNNRAGIFYEISAFGTIYWNQTRRNHLEVQADNNPNSHKGDIDISNSSDCEVYENASDSFLPIIVRHSQTRVGEGSGGETLRNVVRNNDQRVPQSRTGLLVSGIASATYEASNDYYDNQTRVDSLTADSFCWGDPAAAGKKNASEWQAIHPTETVIVDNQAPSLPVGAIPFDATAVGPRIPPVSYDVTLQVGDDFQAAVNANPAGTSYFIAGGVHRMQRVVPKTGNTFTGPSDMSAVLNGSKVLPAASFVNDSANARWYIDGQTQQGFLYGDTQTEPGYSRDYFNEEVFVNGDTRLRHAETLAGMATGQFYFDYPTARIYIKDDPATFSLIETSVSSHAFGGTGVDGCVLKNFVVEKYANPWQFGAIGGDQSNKNPYNWLITDIVAQYNHGVGVMLGPGCKLRYSRSMYNGQLGVGGNGRSADGTYTARCEMSNTEVGYNRQLGVRVGFEGGGTKFALMYSGLDLFQNWVHHNLGYGLWMDIDNTDCQVYSNLSHHNWGHGIFFEVSGDDDLTKPTNIYWNEVHDNAQGLDATLSTSAGIDIANSRNVNVYENLGYNEGRPIQLRMNEDRYEGLIGTHFGRTENVQVYRNDFQATFKIMLFCDSFETQAEADVWAYQKGNGFHDNTHRVPNLTGGYFRWGAIDFTNLTAAQWQAISVHSNETVIASSVQGTMPAGAVPYNPAAVGPRG